MEPITRQISTATNKTDSAARMTAFRTMPVSDLDSLAFAITMRAWSPCIWTGGYRLKKNFLFSDFCALDFDTGKFTVAMAVKMLKSQDLAGIVGVTKSHQKIKDTLPACDRFRLVMPWDGRISDLKTYEQNMMRMMSHLPDPDKACKDGARYFWPCAEIVYQQDGDMLSWLPYREPPPREISRSERHEREVQQVPYWMRSELERPIPHGMRNKTAFRFAIKLKERGLSIDKAIEILSVIDLDRSELNRAITSAYRY